jgi:hypothetical protein
MAESDQAVIQALIDARKALADKKALHSRLAGGHFAIIHAIDEDDKHLVDMLTRYGHREEPAKASIVGGPLNAALAASGKPAVPAKPEPRQLSADEVAAKWIVDYGVSDTARRWSEWLIDTKQLPDPSPVAMFFDKFPATLRQQYNVDRNKAIEALRAQINTWIAKKETKLIYKDSKVAAPPLKPLPVFPKAKESA